MLPGMSVPLARGGAPLLDILLSLILAKFRTFVTWEFVCQNLLWLSVFCGLGQAFNLSATSLPKRSISRLPPHKPFVAESLVPVLTCFGTEPWCGSPFVTGVGWLRPPSKVATSQDSCKGWSEGFCLVPAAAGSAHSSPGGWRGLNCRMARELIRNAGKS